MAFLTLGVIDSVQGQANEALRAELERMYESDQAGRLKMQQIGEEYGFDSDEMKALWEEQTKIDVRNMSRVEEMVQAYGWPVRSLVGDKAANAAFLIVQHADYANQVKYLPLIKAAVEAEALEGQALALLQDRIVSRRGEESDLRYAASKERSNGAIGATANRGRCQRRSAAC